MELVGKHLVAELWYSLKKLHGAATLWPPEGIGIGVSGIVFASGLKLNPVVSVSAMSPHRSTHLHTLHIILAQHIFSSLY